MFKNGLVLCAVLLMVPACGKTTQEYIVGSKGDKGDPGTGCTGIEFEPETNSAYPEGGVVISCGEDFVGIISNGRDGKNGMDAVTQIIDPCGDAPGIYDEVILKLSNGTLLASFSDKANGENTRFSVLTAGTYKTTDGSNCTFTVTAQGAIQ